MVLNQLSEEDFYKRLSNYLKTKSFNKFTELIEKSPELDIHLNPRLIPYCIEYISDLLLDCLNKVGSSYQTSALGEIIDILRFCNQFNLFDKDLSLKEQIIVNKINNDFIFISNLYDLFGKITNSFILYVAIEVPKILYQYLINFPSPYFENTDLLIHYVKNIFWDQYTIYGLSVKKIGSFKTFFDIFKRYSYQSVKDFIEFDIYYKYSSFYYELNDMKEFTIVKRHLVSPKNIFSNADKILNEKDYKFYSLSMVLLGGIGPQGHGFTYSTPKKEVIEICSDIRENNAIIIKYKMFLKSQFLSKLRKKLSSLDENLRDSIINFLDSTLNQKELIGYNKKEKVLKIIYNHLTKFTETLNKNKLNIDNLIIIISEALSIILRPISMVDQFKCRMDLINEGKLNSDDIAKLTSLKGKSHYDVLKERLFFQYINDWFYELYLANKAKQSH
jgi:hypothetical protein